jgi:hypothetical protein
MPVPTPTELPPLSTLCRWVERFPAARIVVWGGARVALVGGPKIHNISEILQDIRGRE